MSLDPALVFTLRACLALLFAAAARHKLRDRAGFRATLRDYRILPAAWVGPAAGTLAGLELALALGLLVPATAFVAGAAAVAVLVVYTAAIGWNLARGRRHVACGCFGPAAEQPLHGGLLLRNGVLVAMALAALLPSSARPLGALDAFTVLAATATLALLGVAVDGLAATTRVAADEGAL